MSNDLKKNLEDLSVSDLDLLIKKAEKLKVKKAEHEKITAYFAAVDLAKSVGMDLNSLVEFGLKSKSKVNTSSKVNAKYKNPNNENESWSGRGKKPKWITEHLTNGGELQELLVAQQ